MIINVALTGAVPTKEDNPSLPTTPEEIAEDAIACAQAGAAIVHLHVRDEDGRPVHDAGFYESAIGPIRQKMPEIIVCATTSGRVDPDPSTRATVLRLDPLLRPDMASLTLGSFNFPGSVSYNPPDVIKALLEEMLAASIKPELEVFEAGMVNTAHSLIEEGLIQGTPYFNILLGSRGAAPAFVGTLAHIVDRLPPDSEWAAAGIGGFQRSMVVAGAVMGGNVRTGLEDAPKMPGVPEWTNVSAVRFATRAAELCGREVADANEARERLGLPAAI